MSQDQVLSSIAAEQLRYMYESMHEGCESNTGQIKTCIYNRHRGLAQDFEVVLEWWRQFGVDNSITANAWNHFHALVLAIHDKRDSAELEKLAISLGRDYNLLSAQQWWTRARDYCNIILPTVLSYGTIMRNYLPRI